MSFFKLSALSSCLYLHHLISESENMGQQHRFPEHYREHKENPKGLTTTNTVFSKAQPYLGN